MESWVIEIEFDNDSKIEDEYVKAPKKKGEVGIKYGKEDGQRWEMENESQNDSKVGEDKKRDHNGSLV